MKKMDSSARFIVMPLLICKRVLPKSILFNQLMSKSEVGKYEENIYSLNSYKSDK